MTDAEIARIAYEITRIKQPGALPWEAISGQAELTARAGKVLDGVPIQAILPARSTLPVDQVEAVDAFQRTCELLAPLRVK